MEETAVGLLGKLSEEEFKSMGKRIFDTTRLSQYMDKNFDDIFQKAPENYNYAVGVLKTVDDREIPEIHYFIDKNGKECFEFMEKHPASVLIYRYPDRFQ